MKKLLVGLIEATLAQVFYEGAEAERDRANAEEEIGEEVGLVNPYGGVG